MIRRHISRCRNRAIALQPTDQVQTVVKIIAAWFGANRNRLIIPLGITSAVFHMEKALHGIGQINMVTVQLIGGVSRQLTPVAISSHLFNHHFTIIYIYIECFGMLSPFRMIRFTIYLDTEVRIRRWLKKPVGCKYMSFVE